MKAQLGVADLAGFGTFSRPELAAVGALLRYVELTQIGKKPVIRAPKRTGAQSVLVIDAASRASLELVRSSSGDKQGSLLAAIDRTVTGPGARELAARLSSPLRDPHAIEARLDAVALLIEDEPLREDVAHGAQGRTGYRAVAVAPGLCPRRSARSCGHSRCAAAGSTRARGC